MADSVGKIQLDLEIDPESIVRETASVDKALSSSLQGTFNRMNSFVKDSMSRMADSFRSMVPGEAKQASSELAERIESLTLQMDNASNMAEMYRQKLKQLARDYELLDTASRKGVFGEQIREDMLKTEERMLRYGAKSDKLRLEIEKLEQAQDRTASTTDRLGRATEKTGRIMDRTGRITDRVGSSFQRAGIQAKASQGVFLGLATSIHRAFMRVLRQVFIFTAMYKAVRGLINYVGAALQTNEQFVYSLNQVKANLATAFMPIYQAVLPALNTFMSWLATATTYIATFISALFGKTYKQSFKAAQGLNAAKQSMSGVGKAAKKSFGDTGKAAKKATKELSGVLAGFDEIHLLAEKSEDVPDIGGIAGVPDAGGVGGLAPPPVNVVPIEADMQELADKVKAFFATIFEPFKKAWENEGQATINAIKHALGGIWALIKEIGKSFVEVWTNGTGQAVLETILRLLQQIFLLIGDIGYTFANVWTEGGRGTAIIQGIANIFLHILELLERIGISMRRVWGEVGETVARTFLDIILATVEVLEHLAEKLIWVWDHGGQHLFESLLKLGAKIFELAGLIYTDFVAPFLHWFIDLMAPVVAELCDWIGWLLDRFIDLIDWLMGDGKPVLDTIVTILGSMAIAFGVVQLAIAIYNGVIAIATALSTAFGAVMAFITSPIGLAVLAIGSLIAIGVLLYKNWDEISAFLKILWEGLKEIASNVFNAIKDVIVSAFNIAKTTVTNIWNGIKTTLSNIWNGIKNTATSVFNGVKTSITNIFNSVKSTVVSIWNSITSSLTNAFNAINNKAKSIFGNMKSFIKGICDSISGFFKGMVNGVIRALNGMIGGLNKLKFDVPDWVPGMGGKKFGFNIPRIPLLAKGGIVDQPTLAMIGEKRKKEAVLPLEQNTGWMDTLAAKIAAVLSGQGGGGEDSPLIIQVMIGGNKILEEVVDAAARKNAKAGRTVVQVGV